jgi:hypothetical protein
VAEEASKQEKMVLIWLKKSKDLMKMRVLCIALLSLFGLTCNFQKPITAINTLYQINCVKFNSFISR